MGRLIFILAVSFGSIIAGYGIQRGVQSKSPRLEKTLPPLSRKLKLLTFFILNPVAVVSTFWGIPLPDSRVLALPVLGLASVLIGMGAALVAIRILKLQPYRAGSVFTCGTLGNVLTVGGLIAYTFLREPGYFLVQLTNLMMYPAHFLLGYPISANVGLGRKPVLKVSLASFKENPFLLLPLAGTALGLGIRATGLARPEVFAGVVAFIVPCSAAAVGLSIGLTLRFTGIRSYSKEIIAVLLIRHLIIPALVIPAAILLGFGRVSDGAPLMVITIIASMPVAFNALVPPAIYGFDLDLANSAWMVSTGLLVVVVPMLFLLLRLMS